MHFKPFWMPCLHIKFFTSAPIPELTAVENFTKRWNGMLGSLSDFKNQFKSRKVLIRLDRNPSIRNEEKKVLIGSEFMFQEGAKLSKYRFFMLLLLRILVRNKTYMLSDWIFLKNILIGQISSHRCSGFVDEDESVNLSASLITIVLAGDKEAGSFAS